MTRAKDLQDYLESFALVFVAFDRQFADSFGERIHESKKFSNFAIGMSQLIPRHIENIRSVMLIL